MVGFTYRDASSVRHPAHVLWLSINTHLTHYSLLPSPVSKTENKSSGTTDTDTSAVGVSSDTYGTTGRPPGALRDPVVVSVFPWLSVPETVPADGTPLSCPFSGTRLLCPFTPVTTLSSYPCWSTPEVSWVLSQGLLVLLSVPKFVLSLSRLWKNSPKSPKTQLFPTRPFHRGRAQFSPQAYQVRLARRRQYPRRKTHTTLTR